MKNSFYNSLSKKYRETGKGFLSQKEIEAYLTARFPATFAATIRVLSEVKKRVCFSPSSLLDLGAGPGTGTLAAREVFSTIGQTTLVENNPLMVAEGKKMCPGDWVETDLLKTPFSPHDLVLFAYSFGELSEKIQPEVLERAWNAAQVLVIVEPGTPRGFWHILKARKLLLGWGAKMIAPCPHAGACPMQGEDWCHFSTRLERTREHRHLKKGTLGWEDEKFSYLCVGKEPATLPEDRLLAPPQKGKGHVRLKLCKGGETILTKKEKPLYKQVQKLKWGDPLLAEHIVEESDDGSK